MRKQKSNTTRLLAVLVVLAMVVAACTDDVADDTTTTVDEGEPVVTTAPPDDDDVEEPDPGEPGMLDTVTYAIFQDIITDNPWSYLDSSGSSTWVAYVLDPGIGAPYTVNFPGLDVAPDMAAGDLEPAVQEGDAWVGTITLRDDLTWSDGEPITAHDYVFTYNTARDFELTANWATYLSASVVEGVEAVDDYTVQVTFNDQPGLAVWGLGNGPPLMPVFPEHHWGPVVEQAAGTDSPSDTLIAASGVGAPSAGVTVFGNHEEGSFAATTANESYYDAGTVIESGGVSYDVGPFASNFNYPIYGTQEAAVLALAAGEVDLLLNPLGMARGLRDQVVDHPDLEAVVNPSNGFRFLAFNHERAPMDDPAFRDALTAMVNKEYVTENLLQGAVFPIYVIMPEGNIAWYNEGVAEELKAAGYEGLDDDTRRATAIQILTDAGYSWPEGQAPGWYDGEDYSTEPAEGYTFAAAAGDLIGPDGSTIETLELLHPTAGYDNLRAVFGGYIAGVAREIGMPVSSVPTDFNKIIDIVFELDENQEFTSDYDMFILGYSLGNPAFPTYHGDFFGTGGGSNNTQYSDPDYDALVAELNAADNVEDAYAAMWELERLIARDKPHLVLFDTGILEFHNTRVAFPFTDSLHGLQNLNGLPGSVTTE